MIDVKKFRKEKKLTQVAFGQLMGYTHAYISNVENKKEPVTDNFLDRLHEVFGIEVEEFKSYNQKPVIEDPGEEYLPKWKEKYYELLEKYNHCLEEKEVLSKKVADKEV
ncbi:helix-turn-helix domain-containing protein [Taibaiella koreensis]|uniref:helix-turn-helix domain-containing protein n=1 Tax=Taibaiella koreensis TaxID=1268548 RepID=UPI000E5998B2|nr:helix-turn-helix transcriptional regulator [Taibaiella koreensis]